MPKTRTPFLPTILVIILGVNLGAWTLSVATAPGSPLPPLTIPVSSQGIDAQSQAASAAASDSANPIPSPSAAIPVVDDTVSVPADATTTEGEEPAPAK